MVHGRILYAIGDEKARSALGDNPDLLTDDEPLAAAIVCDAPPWSNVSTYYRTPEMAAMDHCEANDPRAPRQFCEIEEPKSVCLRVTLNEDPHQHSGEGGHNCVRYTYFDQ